MERLIYAKLKDWKQSKSRKPLIVRGARQVGKSWVIEEFGREEFEGQLLVINFEKRPDIHQLFEKNLDPKRIILELELIMNIKVSYEKDLLFFDEIQECPNAILALRYFYEEIPGLHLIAAGSLLEFALKEVSFPVGRVQLMNMYPMNFYEFLIACNKNRMAEFILEAPEESAKVINDTIRDELRKYLIVGGMPESVKTFVETNSFQNVFSIQDDLIDTFRQDFSKYALHSDKRCLNQVLTSVSLKAGQQIKYTQLAEGFTSPTIKKAFELLETARLFKKIKATPLADVPLSFAAKEKKFKTIFLDIGLLCRINKLSIGLSYETVKFADMFKGMLAEQFVGQELLSALDNDLFTGQGRQKAALPKLIFLLNKVARSIQSR
jgi:predicted AAA+ superfamily ATPase